MGTWYRLHVHVSGNEGTRYLVGLAGHQEVSSKLKLHCMLKSLHVTWAYSQKSGQVYDKCVATFTGGTGGCTGGTVSSM